MSDGWVLLRPNKRFLQKAELNLRGGSATINAVARRTLGLEAGGQLEVAVKPTGEISLRAARPGIEPTVRLSPNGDFGALAPWARVHGFEPGRYALVERDGVLSCRLTKMGATNP